MDHLKSCVRTLADGIGISETEHFKRVQVLEKAIAQAFDELSAIDDYYDPEGVQDRVEDAIAILGAHVR